jgi:hypothetical protein
LLYFGFEQDLSILTIPVYALGVYYAYSLTRITRGAPAAWYVIILALVLLLLRRVVGIYPDLQAPASVSDIEETVLAFLVALLLSVGLLMLARTFRRQLKISQELQTRP